MIRCWHKDPRARPSMEMIVEDMERMKRDNQTYSIFWDDQVWGDISQEQTKLIDKKKSFDKEHYNREIGSTRYSDFKFLQNLSSRSMSIFPGRNPATNEFEVYTHPLVESRDQLQEVTEEEDETSFVMAEDAYEL